MKVARLLLDEMLSPTIAENLRDRGHDVDAVAARPDLLSLPDDQVLAVATTERRAVVTLNLGDFAILDALWRGQGRSHAGLIYVSTATFPQDRGFVGAMVVALDTAVRDVRLPAPEQSRLLSRA